MTRPAPAGRVFALDNLRAALVVLVVLYHASLVYSGFAPFYYWDPAAADPATVLILGLFALINQAWFMSALFFIAGYFTPDSYDRKGLRAFVGGRLLRLGAPLLIGFFVLEPIARIGFLLAPPAATGGIAPPAPVGYFQAIGLGPLWFVALLLVFSLAYATWRWAIGKHAPPGGHRRPTIWEIRFFVLSLAFVTYFWRMLVPLGQNVTLYGDALSFPTMAYLPHSLALFIFGIVAKRNRWVPLVTPRVAWIGFFAALIATIVLLPWALSGSFFLLSFSPGAEFLGHGTWQSALYALWDAMVCIGLLVAALGLFEARIDREGPIWGFLARQSYAAYLIQAIVVVFAAYALSGIEAPALAKFVLLAVIAVPVAFGLGYAVRLIPGVKRAI